MYVTSAELKDIKRRASQERAKHLGHVMKAVVATLKALLSGTVPGGFRAAQ